MPLYQVTTRKACAAFGTRINKAGNEIVVFAAPILSYMKGWSVNRVREHGHRYSWRIETVDEPLVDIPEADEAWFQKARLVMPEDRK